MRWIPLHTDFRNSTGLPVIIDDSKLIILVHRFATSELKLRAKDESDSGSDYAEGSLIVSKSDADS